MQSKDQIQADNEIISKNVYELLYIFNITHQHNHAASNCDPINGRIIIVMLRDGLNVLMQTHFE